MPAFKRRISSLGLRVAVAAILGGSIAGCTGSALESVELTNPSYTSPTVADAVAAPGFADDAANVATDGAAPSPTAVSAADLASPIVPLASEQQDQIESAEGFVPMSRPAGAESAVINEAAAANPSLAAGVAIPVPTAKPAVATAAAPLPATAQQVVTATPPPTSQQVVTASSFAAQTPQKTDAVKKKGFLAGLFSQKAQDAPVMAKPPAQAPKPVLRLASAKPVEASLMPSPARSSAATSLGSDLPGVRKSSLFEITRKDSLDDDSDVDLHEDEMSPVQVASAAGLARLAPNGLIKQRDSVDVSCLKPSLVRMLKQIERHYGKKLVVTSGYRSPTYNRKVRGAKNSMHMYCAAADVHMEGITKWELARYARSMPGRGGVGTYCHTDAIHIDVGPERDWNWRCRSRRK